MLTEQLSTPRHWEYDTSGLLFGNDNPRPITQLTEGALARLDELNPPRTSFFSLDAEPLSGYLVPVSRPRPKSSPLDAIPILGHGPLDDLITSIYKNDENVQQKNLFRKNNPENHTAFQPIKQRFRAQVPGIQALDRFRLYPSTLESPAIWLGANRNNLLQYIWLSDILDFTDRTQLTRWVNKGTIYERCTIYVYECLKTKSRGSASWHHLAELNEFMQSWSIWDTVTALHNHRLVFDRLQSFHRLRGGDFHKTIVALDIHSICARVYGVLQGSEEYRRFVNLSGKQAQEILDLLQTLLDSTALYPSYRHSFTNALIRLSKKSGLYPESLLQAKVILRGEEAIAAGQFGEVWEGTFQGRRVAVKVLKMYSRSDRTKHLKKVLHETLIWRQLRHPNVLPFLCLHHINNNSAKISLVSPWMKNGNVQDFLRKTRDVNRLSLVRDIAEGLEYLHTMQPTIIHGDLKAVNILITDTHRACLADFGLSTASDSQALNLTSFSSAQTGGTSRWTAPELLNGDQAHNNKESDVYAFACVCYEIFSGNVPFHNIINDYPVILKVIQGQRPQRPKICEPYEVECASIGLDDDIWDLVESCWTNNPDDRPPMGEVITFLPEILPVPISRRATIIEKT